MPSASKPWWQQATALVSLGAGGAVTGLSFVPRPAADLTSPASLPVHLMALEQSARPAAADDGALRSAIVNVANYYRRMAESKTPAEMEAIIWQHDSIDGANHGASCAAFASMTLELGAHVTGQQSWVSGGSSYPWPLHDWVDARVNPNPASPGITSIVQDAEAHHRWHAVGDGYQPLPGDWVVFNGHVEVVTKYAGGVLSTIGGDSVPNFSVNAHEYPGPLASQGVAGFVNNGALPAVADKVLPGGTAAPAGQQTKQKADGTRRQAASSRPAAPSGLPVAAAPAMAADPAGAMADTTVIPGLPIMAHRLSPGPKAPAAHYKSPGSKAPAAHYKRHNPAPVQAPVHDVSSQQAFIGEIARRSHRRAAQVRCPGIGDDRPGDRRVGLGTEHAGDQGSQPVRHQGHGPGRQRSAADAGVPERAAGGDHQLVPRLQQHRGKHRRSRQAPGDQRLLRHVHGRPAEPERVRAGAHRDLCHRPGLRHAAHQPDAAVQPVPVRRCVAGPQGRAHCPGGGPCPGGGHEPGGGQHSRAARGGTGRAAQDGPALPGAHAERGSGSGQRGGLTAARAKPGPVRADAGAARSVSGADGDSGCNGSVCRSGSGGVC